MHSVLLQDIGGEADDDPLAGPEAGRPGGARFGRRRPGGVGASPTSGARAAGAGRTGRQAGAAPSPFLSRMSAPMLSAMRAEDALIESRARCA